ncbi:hypothetical protein DPMN_033750 [Dreissena polymorpha]|uniref:Uncharacterized protein n=1 Tax=Dreissena polymorpha TaxID=45954 RepID=A0A9D4M472_DREPO|nr:hypothetical protein DPMN_033750 [Dreissena polymorpha]
MDHLDSFDCYPNENTQEEHFITQNRYVIPSAGNSCKTDNNRKRTRVNTRGECSSDKEITNQYDFERLSLDEKMSVMFQQMKNMEKKVDECLQLHTKIDSIEGTLTDHNARPKLLEYKSIDIEALSRSNNLIFSGISEHRDENCQNVISQFFAEQLNIMQCPQIQRARNREI